MKLATYSPRQRKRRTPPPRLLTQTVSFRPSPKLAERLESASESCGLSQRTFARLATFDSGTLVHMRGHWLGRMRLIAFTALERLEQADWSVLTTTEVQTRLKELTTELESEIAPNSRPVPIMRPICLRVTQAERRQILGVTQASRGQLSNLLRDMVDQSAIRVCSLRRQHCLRLLELVHLIQQLLPNPGVTIGPSRTACLELFAQVKAVINDAASESPP